ncbi:MAG: hypothetical protein LBJ67_08010 [Planctomycetaceae bacterium]|jgi:hypothetical protein|nr:hypothetical protein [Planctomycetaceae bacterium]
MKNIVVFGKPKAFESYEYEFEEQSAVKNENTHIEPYIKPLRQKEAILHYYAKDDYVCYEYYAHTKGFDSDRVGSVFGVGVKANRDINLFVAQNCVLLPFCKDLSNSFLHNDNSFNSQSIINKLSKTVWSEDEQQTIGDVVNAIPFPTPNKELLLLVVSDFAEVSNIENKIKEYSDVYITNNQDIFKDDNNSLYLKRSNSQIFTVENGNIVLFAKKTKKEEDNGRKEFKRSSDKKENGETERKEFEEGKDSDENSNSSRDNPLPTPTSWLKPTTTKIVGTLAVCLIILFFVLKNCRGNGNTGGGADTGDTHTVTPTQSFVANSVQLASHNGPIEKSLNLNPKPLYNGTDKTITLKSEIQLQLLGGANCAEIQGTTLKVTSRPDNDTKVTVIAKLGDVELGRQDYTIAKKEVVTPPPPANSESKYASGSVTIHFDKNRNKNTLFSVGDTIIAVTKSHSDTCRYGEWTFSDGLAVVNNQQNSVTLKCKNAGRSTLTFCFTNTNGAKETAAVSITVAP